MADLETSRLRYWLKQANDERLCDNGVESSFFSGHVTVILCFLEDTKVPPKLLKFIINQATPIHQDGLRNLVTAHNKKTVEHTHALSSLIALLSHSIQSEKGNKKAIQGRYNDLQYLFEIYTGKPLVL